MEQDIDRPVSMELRVAINALAQYSTVSGASENIRLRALEYVDQIEERTALEKAAPDMYEALKGCVEYLSQCCYEDYEYWKSAEQALAKAEGKTE